MSRISIRGRLTGLALIALASSVLEPNSLRAQEIRGTVVAPDGRTPARGVVVVLLHPTIDDSIMARAISTERGRFVLKSSPVTGARLRLLRIGFEPMSVGTVTLAAGDLRDVSYTLSDVRIQLASVNVKSESRCELRPDGAKLVAQLFMQARTALIASTVPEDSSISASQIFNFRRRQDRRGQLTVPLMRTTQTGRTTRPYASIGADSLSKVGYVYNESVEEGGGAYYYAPDAGVLLSDQFLSTHCLQVVQGKDSLENSVGIGFRPSATKSELVDVRGTLWIDRATSELQFLEYMYDGLPGYMRDAGLGGRVEYAKLSSGTWFVSEWSIRMPVLSAMAVTQEGTLSRLNATNRIVVSGQIIEGGSVQSIRAADQQLYLNANASSVGSSPRDAEDEKEALKANFAASASAADATRPVPTECSTFLKPGYLGWVRGRVLDTNRVGVKGVPVKAEWWDQMVLAGDGLKWRSRSLETTTDQDGVYQLCGISTQRVNRVALFKDSLWSLSTDVRVSKMSPTAVVDMMYSLRSMDVSKPKSPAITASVQSERIAPTSSSVRSASIVVTDLSGQAIPYAVVTVNGGAVRVANSAGTAEFNPGGKDTVKVFVRRIGYQAFEGNLVRASFEDPFQVSLAPNANTLSTVNVRDKIVKSPLELNGFYARMHDVQRGSIVAEFMTPEQLEARASIRFSDILVSSRYVKVDRVGSLPVPRGRANCVMSLVVDGHRINNMYQGDSKDRGTRATIDDLLSGSDIAAIEVYPSIANAPAALQPLTGAGSCGMIVVWTGGRQ